MVPGGSAEQAQTGHCFGYHPLVRVVTWNCYRGDARERADELLLLTPDLILLQEVSAPKEPTESCLWFEVANPQQGIGIIALNGYSVQQGPLQVSAPRSVFPVIVSGRDQFHILAVWAQREPGYVEAVNLGLSAYCDFLRAAPSVVAGDFNSHQRWDTKSKRPEQNHAALVERLRDEFGLVSAYHEAPPGVRPLGEEPTLFWQWRETQPFHVDYCFVPTSWAERTGEIQVGSYAAWADRSDHRPLLIDIAPGVL